MKINVKSNKGVTITGLVIYVSSFLMICTIIGVITTFFFNNTKFLSSEATASAEYDILNAYLAKEAKRDETTFEIVSEGNEINFSSGNKFIYNADNGQIYLCNTQTTPNKYFIVADFVQDAKFTKNGDAFSILVKILGKEYQQTYNLAD